MWKLLGAVVVFLGIAVSSAELRGQEPEQEAPAPRPSPARAEGEKYDLKYKFAAGETLRSEVVHRAKVQTTIQGTTQTAETESRSVKVWVVENVADDGTVTFEHRVENIDMWQRTTGRQEVRYNSETDKEAPPGYEHMAEAVGVPLSTVTMDVRGTIVKRKENQELPTSVSTQMTMPLAERPIAIGESWSSPLEIEVTQKDGSLKKIETRQKFTLEGVAEDVATIKVDSQILTPVHDPSIEAQLIQRLSQGTVRFDIAAGRVLSQQLDLDRHVIGFSGAASSMHYVTRFTEKLLPAPRTARQVEQKAAVPQAGRKR
jgi:hypothetical protein